MQRIINTEGYSVQNLRRYASILQYRQQYDSAITLLNKHHAIDCSRDYHILLAELYNIKNDTALCIQHYTAAVYITPHKLATMQRIMHYHIKNGNTLQAKHWANNITNMPMKILTTEGASIKKEALLLLKRF
jgi:hypothetical protein